MTNSNDDKRITEIQKDVKSMCKMVHSLDKTSGRMDEKLKTIFRDRLPKIDEKLGEMNGSVKAALDLSNKNSVVLDSHIKQRGPLGLLRKLIWG